jgi:hypothetical protein
VNETALVQHSPTSGTDGGTATSGSYQTRTLDTLVNPHAVTWISLASNQVTLSAGTYNVSGFASAYRIDNHTAQLYNVTDAATQVLGMTATNNSSDFTATSSQIFGTFTITGTKVFEVRHRVQTTKASNGYGLSSGFGHNELYVNVMFTKM